MKAYEAVQILKGLADDHEVRLDIGVAGKRKVTPPTPPTPPTPAQPTTIWNQDTREWVIGKQFWPKQDTNPYPNYVYCTNTGTMQ